MAVYDFPEKGRRRISERRKNTVPIEEKYASFGKGLELTEVGALAFYYRIAPSHKKKL